MKLNTAYIENLLEKYKIQLTEFFIKYKNILLIGILTGIFVNAIDIFTIKFGIDAEVYALYNNPLEYFNTQRYGSYILYYILPFARFHIISQLTGIIALTFAALLTVSRHNISNTAKLLFVLLFVTYPNFTFLQYFYFQSAYNFIGLLFVVIGYRLIETNKNIFLYIFALFLLFMGISSYQVNFAVYLSVMMINVILDYIEDKDFKKALKAVLKGSAVLVVVCIIYYIIILIISSQINSYHSSYIVADYHNFTAHITSVFIFIKEILLGRGAYGSHTANNTFTYLLLITIMIYLVVKCKNKQERFFFILFIILFLLGMFSLPIILGTKFPIRASIYIAFYGAFIVLLFYISSPKNIIKVLSVIITVSAIMYHCYYQVQYQTTYVLRYEQDKITAADIISKIIEKYPDIYDKEYKIVFTGVVYRNLDHPLLVLKEIIGASPFYWEWGNAVRIYAFLTLHGLPYQVKLGNITDEMQETIKQLPSYPDKNCIGLYKDTIIVKLR